MKHNVSAFDKLRPVSVLLAEWKSPSPPKWTENPVRAIMLFARHMGMRFIPEKTMDRLRHDPYLRYCFYLLNMNGTVYDRSSWIGKEYRNGLLRLLKEPDSMTDRDLYLGLQQYLNNFIGYLPGGFRVGLFKEIAEISESLKRIFNAVERALKEEGLTEKAVLLRTESKEEELEGYRLPTEKESYAKRAAFMKLALEVFNVLVERDGFYPQELWT